ncbi:hypothetical protein D3C81_1219690 [compost metagenome]
MVFGILHGLEQRAGLQRLIALFQEADVVVAPDKAHVRRGVDKRMGVLQYPLLDLPGEKLTGNLERLVDLHCLADVDLAIFLWRVVQLCQRRMAGTGVVPAVGAFFGDLVQAFNHLHRPAWLQFVEPDGQGRTHDATAHQQYIDLFGFSRLGIEHAHSQRQPRQHSLRIDRDFHVLSRAPRYCP